MPISPTPSMTGVTRLSTHEQWKRDIRTYQPDPMHPAIFREGEGMSDPLERRACLQGRVGMAIDRIGYSTQDWDIQYNPTSRRQKLHPGRYHQEREYWFRERVDPVANHPVFAEIEAGYKRFCASGRNCVHPYGPVLPADDMNFYTNKARVCPSNPSGFYDVCRECWQAAQRQDYKRRKEQTYHKDNIKKLPKAA